MENQESQSIAKADVSPVAKFNCGDQVRPPNSRFLIVAVAGMDDPRSPEAKIIPQGQVVVSRGPDLLLMDESFLELE